MRTPSMVICLLLFLLLTACSTAAAPQQPAPDPDALKATITADVIATITAQTATPFPIPTPPSTPTAAPTSTPRPLSTVELVEQIRPSVVQIWTDTQQTGSGTLVTANGCILTAQHVVEGQQRVSVYTRKGHTNHTMNGNVVGTNEALELAVVKISGGPWPYTEITEYIPRVGEDIIVVGFAANLTGPPSVNKGIVSETRADRAFTVIQTDASINKGDSGGIMVNSRGDFFAMPTTKLVGETVDNIGFALAFFSVGDDLRRLIDQCKNQEATQ